MSQDIKTMLGELTVPQWRRAVFDCETELSFEEWKMYKAAISLERENKDLQSREVEMERLLKAIADKLGIPSKGLHQLELARILHNRLVHRNEIVDTTEKPSGEPLWKSPEFVEILTRRVAEELAKEGRKVVVSAESIQEGQPVAPQSAQPHSVGAPGDDRQKVLMEFLEAQHAKQGQLRKQLEELCRQRRAFGDQLELLGKRELKGKRLGPKMRQKETALFRARAVLCARIEALEAILV